jgi:hypothetical protein
MKNRRLFILICALGIVGIGLLYQKRLAALKTQVTLVEDAENTETTMHLGALPEARLVDLDSGSRVTLRKQDTSENRLVVFLSAADCASCLTILDGLQTLPERARGSGLSISLIFVRGSEAEAKSYITDERARGIAQPYAVYVDSFGDVERRVGLPRRTPVAVLVDGRFDVKAAIGATNNQEEQADFFRNVVQLSTPR